jgi:hypothetical protein
LPEQTEFGYQVSRLKALLEAFLGVSLRSLDNGRIIKWRRGINSARRTALRQ